MNHPKTEIHFVLILLFAIFVVTFFIFKPFLYALILAMVFATLFDPINTYILSQTGQRRGLSALLSAIVVLIVIVVPISLLGVQIFQEATQLYTSLTENGGATDLSRAIEEWVNTLKSLSPVPIESSFDVNQSLRQGLQWVLHNLGPIFSNIASIFMGIFVFLVALYYLFKDGKKFKANIVALSPLEDKYDEVVFTKLAGAVDAVMKGSFAVALIQGVVSGIGFFMFGVPNPVLWGTVTAIAALIPGIGTGMVVIPAILYLFLNGQTFAALALLVWGIVAVGLIDNYLGPKLAERGMKIHTFLILLSILGGVGLFGPLGFLLGPLTLSLLFALLEIYFSIHKKYNV